MTAVNSRLFAYATPVAEYGLAFFSVSHHGPGLVDLTQ